MAKSYERIIMGNAMAVSVGVAFCLGAAQIAVPAWGSRDLNAPPVSAVAPAGLVEDTDDGWTWTGMVELKGDTYHGGTVHAGGPGTSGVYVFQGAGVELYGLRGSQLTAGGHDNAIGSMKITVDGKAAQLVNLSSSESAADAKVFSVSGLSAGNHVLQVKVVDGWGAVDRISILQASETAAAVRDFIISPRHAPGMCLDTEQGGLADNTALVISRPSAKRNQVWHLTSLGNDLYRISPKDDPSLALTVLNRKSDGNPCARGGLYAYAGVAAQQWHINAVSGRYCTITSALDGKCLDVYDSGQVDGTAVITFSFQGEQASNEFWLFEPAGK